MESKKVFFEMDKAEKNGAISMTLNTNLRSEILERDIKIVRLMEEVKKLREINSQTFCAYCEEKFARDDSDYTTLQNHINVCKKHPLRAAEAEVERLRAALAIYADHNHWDDRGDWPSSFFNFFGCDEGPDIAIAALSCDHPADGGKMVGGK